MTTYITKRDGAKEPFNADQINRSIERACQGFLDPVSMVTQIATETHLTLYDGITTDELDQATINAAVQNIKEDIEYDKVATRLLLKTIYRKVIGDYDKDSNDDLKKKHRDGFTKYVKQGVQQGRLHPDMAAKYDLEAISDTLDLSRDELFVYAGLDGLMNRYGIKDTRQQPLETPQYLFMRIAMGLSYNEANPTEWAKKFYNKMSKMNYIAGGSTNLGAGTTRPALSNCFLLEIQDNIENIAKSVADVMLLSKGSGGLGVSLTKLRAGGSPLKSNFGGVSTGPTSFAKIIDTAIRAIQRGGKKKGACAFYMENWHHDFPEYLDWKHNAGDDYLRMRTANTAVFLSDEFMKRVQAGDDWYMFDPAETPDLNELYGKAFSDRYQEYVKMADAGKMRTYKRVPATEQYRQILVALQTTSHPWLIWKDSINLRALNNNTGTIHMSNLCTEICLPQDKDNVAVCNLISVNLAAHISNKEINWSKLEDSVRMSVRQLDNLIDINVLPIPEAVKSDSENRAIGLGVMGFSDAIEQLGMAYDSEPAWDFADRIFEFVSYMAIDESANLATVRGSYKNFPGSEWSKGKVPFDTLARLEADRGRRLTVSLQSKHKGLNWDVLREKVKKGIRNSTLMAVAPNANIGILAGTTPGIDPRFAQVFSRNKISGKYMDINHNLVKDLKNMNLWEKVRDAIIEKQGDISDIPGIPQHLKDIYKTSFTTSPHAFIEVAARAQKWVDQALSRNMYLETRDIDETMQIYSAAWDKGLKSTYYLHMKPRHTAEQSTTNVNKSAMTGKKGFGVLANAAPAANPAQSQPSPFQVLEKQERLDIFAPVAAASVTVMKPEPAMAMAMAAASSEAPAGAHRGFAAVAVAEPEEVPASIQNAMTLPKKEVPAAKTVEVPKGMGFGAVAHSAAPSAAFASVPAKPASSPMPTAAASAEPTTAMGAAIAAAAVKKKPKVCPTDPAELAQCDSCQ